MRSKIEQERKEQERKLSKLNYDIDRYQRQMDELTEKHKKDKGLEFSDLIEEYPWKYIFEADRRDKNGLLNPYTDKEVANIIDKWYMDVIKSMQTQLDDYKQSLKEITLMESDIIDLTRDDRSSKRKRFAEFVLIPFNPKTNKDILNENEVIVPLDGTPIKVGRSTWLGGNNVFISREAVQVYDAQNGSLSLIALRPTIKIRPLSGGVWRKVDTDTSVKLSSGSQVLLLQDVLAFRIAFGEEIN